MFERKYECVKPLVLERYDDDCFPNGIMTIEVGTGWYEDEESTHNMIASNDAFRLIQITENNHGAWIEIHEDTLEDHFIKLD